MFILGGSSPPPLSPSCWEPPSVHTCTMTNGHCNKISFLSLVTISTQCFLHHTEMQLTSSVQCNVYTGLFMPTVCTGMSFQFLASVLSLSSNMKWRSILDTPNCKGATSPLACIEYDVHSKDMVTKKAVSGQELPSPCNIYLQSPHTHQTTQMWLLQADCSGAAEHPQCLSLHLALCPHSPMNLAVSLQHTCTLATAKRALWLGFLLLANAERNATTLASVKLPSLSKQTRSQ